jgi:hypothetical protein
LPRLADIDRPTGLPVRRYEVCHPGALVHQDHKKLGRIPDGGGHWVHGRSTEMRRKPKLGYDHFEVVVDDRSRRSVVVEVPDESGASAATALAQALAVFAADGIAVERVLTDNGLAPAQRREELPHDCRVAQSHLHPARNTLTGNDLLFATALIGHESCAI